MVGTTMDNFILLPDQTYHDIDYQDDHEDSDSDSNDDSEEYLREMEIILRKLRRKKSKNQGKYDNYRYNSL